MWPSTIMLAQTQKLVWKIGVLANEIGRSCRRTTARATGPRLRRGKELSVRVPFCSRPSGTVPSALASELVNLPVDLIVACGTQPASLPAGRPAQFPSSCRPETRSARASFPVALAAGRETSRAFRCKWRSKKENDWSCSEDAAKFLACGGAFEAQQSLLHHRRKGGAPRGSGPGIWSSTLWTRRMRGSLTMHSSS